MDKTSYQVSDASIKRYWQLKIANDNLRAIDIYEDWVKSESFCKYTKWEALGKIAKEDQGILEAIVLRLREKTEKLNKINEAFEIINEIKA